MIADIAILAGLALATFAFIAFVERLRDDE